MVSTSFITSQIDKINFSKALFAIFKWNLQDGMGPGGLTVGRVLRGDSLGTATFKKHLKLLNTAHWNLRKPHNINVRLSILSQDELISLVEKIIQFGTVDLIKRKIGRKVTVFGLIYKSCYLCQPFKNIAGSKRIQAGNVLTHHSIHCVCFSRPGLTIGKTRHFSALKRRIYQRRHDWIVNLG